jgi:dihydropteroate synthase
MTDWQIRGRELDGSRPLVMGIINVTPDSFSDGGDHFDPLRAMERVREALREGADLVDIGGESTRPGAPAVPLEEELRRVIPVIEAAVELGAVVSVDTSKAEVARRALEAGARVVNDVTALKDPDLGRVVAETGAGLVLMHMQGTPGSMQETPQYGDVSRDVTRFLRERRKTAENLGVAREAIVLDPGIGFGKTVTHNLELLARLDELVGLGSPVLVGTSRKSFLGSVNREPDPRRRGAGSLATVVLARGRGASLFRVHDVAATRQALDTADAVLGAGR